MKRTFKNNWPHQPDVGTMMKYGNYESVKQTQNQQSFMRWCSQTYDDTFTGDKWGRCCWKKACSRIRSSLMIAKLRQCVVPTRRIECATETATPLVDRLRLVYCSQWWSSFSRTPPLNSASFLAVRFPSYSTKDTSAHQIDNTKRKQYTTPATLLLPIPPTLSQFRFHDFHSYWIISLPARTKLLRKRVRWVVRYALSSIVFS